MTIKKQKVPGLTLKKSRIARASRRQSELNASRTARRYPTIAKAGKPIHYKTDRECERRRNQIKCGQLKADNGLVL